MVVYPIHSFQSGAIGFRPALMPLYYNTDYCSRYTANDIANFCDRLCNYGMIIKTEPKASRFHQTPFFFLNMTDLV
ncbi:hypothetical protein [Nostoc sp.]|uniref:hypothetical protein n=1 Tax=Nostoc sp. TaxID=1180 RepID=UPI002FEEAB1F